MSDPVRRFYKAATVDGDGVLLDQRRLKTPRGAPFVAPTRALAEAVAAEWDAQVEHILPRRMPITQFAFAAIDATPGRRDELARYIAKFGETELICHRAGSPAPLVKRQSDIWDPLIAWAAHELGIVLPVVTGVVAAPSNDEAIETLYAHAASSDDFYLTGLSQAAGLASSAIVAFALARGRLDNESAFAAAALDELWGLETWGEDAQARARLEHQRAEFAALGRFFAALDAK